MKQVEIAAELRGAGKGVARKLRAAGRLPGVLYGKGTESLPLSLDRRAFEKLVKHDKNVLLKVQIAGAEGSKVRNAMVKEVELDPLKREPLHVDLLQINLEDKLKVKIPIHVVGEDAITSKGLILQHQKREVEVECLPVEVPDSIRVDVSHLNAGDRVMVADLKTGESVRITEDGNELVLSILAPKAEEEAPAPAAEEAPAEPELVKKPKEEE